MNYSRLVLWSLRKLNLGFLKTSLFTKRSVYFLHQQPRSNNSGSKPKKYPSSVFPNHQNTIPKHWNRWEGGQKP